MSERWRAPAGILDAVPGDTLVLMPSGETMQQANVAVDSETIQRLLEGRVCMNCLEPLEIPFPEVCEALTLPDGTPVGCGYRVRANQLRDLEMKYGSLEEVKVGSQVKLYDELERMREMDAYEEKTGIILPPSVKFPNETQIEET